MGLKSELMQCPTYQDHEEPLFTHQISRHSCAKLQGQYYHKCFKCIFNSRRPHTNFKSVHTVVRQTLCVAAKAQ